MVSKRRQMTGRDCRRRGREDTVAFLVEAIEPRLMLAGNVDVMVVGQDLVVTGDALANEILVEPLLPGQIRVSSGFSPTTINGNNGPIVFSGVTRDLRFQMGEGADSVTIDNVSVSRDVNYQGGNGNNGFALVDSDVGRNVRIGNLTGEDDIGLQDSTVSGNVQIANRNGGSYTALNDVEVGGNLNVTNQDGLDYLFVADSSTVYGNVRHTTGAGDSDTGIFNSAIEGRLQVNGGNDSDDLSMTSSTVSGDVRFNGRGGADLVDVFYTNFQANTFLIMGGNQDDIAIQYGIFDGNLSVRSSDAVSVDLFGISVDGKTAIVTGNGNDFFEIDNSTFEGSFRLTSRGGDDNVDLEESGLPVSPDVTEFKSAAIIRLGAGDDVMEVGIMSNPSLSAVFQASVTFNGGPGANDWLDHLTNGNTYVIPPNVVGFELET